MTSGGSGLGPLLSWPSGRARPRREGSDGQRRSPPSLRPRAGPLRRALPPEPLTGAVARQPGAGGGACRGVCPTRELGAALGGGPTPGAAVGGRGAPPLRPDSAHVVMLYTLRAAWWHDLLSPGACGEVALRLAGRAAPGRCGAGRSGPPQGVAAPGALPPGPPGPPAPTGARRAVRPAARPAVEPARRPGAPRCAGPVRWQPVGARRRAHPAGRILSGPRGPGATPRPGRTVRAGPGVRREAQGTAPAHLVALSTGAAGSGHPPRRIRAALPLGSARASRCGRGARRIPEPSPTKKRPRRGLQGRFR